MDQTPHSSSSRPRAAWLAAGLGAVVILASLPWTWFRTGLAIRDETGHVHAVRLWVEHPESLSLADFPEPKGIGFFAAARVWGKVFGTSYPALRSMSVVTAICVLAAWAVLTGLWRLPRRFLAGIALLAAPYFFIYSQLLYTEMPALLLTVLSLICLQRVLRDGKWTWAVLLAIVLGSLLWVRQTLIAVPAGILACLPWVERHRQRIALAAGASMLALAPLVVLWGGLVPPSASRYAGAGWYPGTFTFALGGLGAMGWPLLLTHLPHRREWIFLGAGAALGMVLYCVFPQDFMSVDRMGMLQKALISMPGPPWVAGAAFLVAVLAGGLVLGRLTCLATRRGEPHWARLSCLICLAIICSCAVATPVFYDRNLMLPVVLIFLLASQRARRTAAWAFVAVFLAVAAAHATYITIKPETPRLPVPLRFSQELPRPVPGGAPWT